MTRRTIQQLGAGAIEAYRECGWRFTEHGHLDDGSVSGPCSLCGKTTVVYGKRGNPLCLECRKDPE